MAPQESKDFYSLSADVRRSLSGNGLFAAFGGGVGRFGTNFAWFKAGSTIIWIDVGAGFPDANTPGLQKILPDLRLLNYQPPTAIILTHAHEDHIGALPHVVSLVPDGTLVYASPYTIAMVRGRMQENGIPDTKFEFIPVEHNTSFEIGRFFVSTFFMPHSIPQTYSVGLRDRETGRKIYFTSDFKTQGAEPRFSQKDIRRFGPVDYLLIDSTGALNPGYADPEHDVIVNLEKTIKEWPGRIFIATFSSQIERIRAVFEIGKKLNRPVGLQGYSLKSHLRAAYAAGEFSIPPHQWKDPGAENKKSIWLLAGCQSEAGSSFHRLAHGRLTKFSLGPNDLLIYSGSMIPGNEGNIFESLNNIARTGAKVLGIATQQKKLHTSGHGKQEDILKLIDWVQPARILPVHGDPLHFHAFREIITAAKLKAALHLVYQGHIYHLGKELSEVAEINYRPAFIDGNEIHHDRDLYEQRQQLGKFGVCTIGIDRNTGTLLKLRYTGVVTPSYLQEHHPYLEYEIKTLITTYRGDGSFEQNKNLRKKIDEFHQKKLGKIPAVIIIET